MKACGKYLAGLKEKGCRDVISDWEMQQACMPFINVPLLHERGFPCFEDFPCHSAGKLFVNKINMHFKQCLHFRRCHFRSSFILSQTSVTDSV